jgi:hypothetical protein
MDFICKSMLISVIFVLYLFDFQGTRNGFALIGGGKRYEVNIFLTAYSNFSSVRLARISSYKILL